MTELTRSQKSYRKNREKRLENVFNYRREFPEKLILTRAKARSKRYGIPFNLELEDIVIPETCPILGIKLSVGLEEGRNNSPSLDKIIPEKGYVRDNVQVISNRANQLKGDLTPAQAQRLVDYFQKNLDPHK